MTEAAAFLAEAGDQLFFGEGGEGAEGGDAPAGEGFGVFGGEVEDGEGQMLEGGGFFACGDDGGGPSRHR